MKIKKKGKAITIFYPKEYLYESIYSVLIFNQHSDTKTIFIDLN